MILRASFKGDSRISRTNCSDVAQYSRTRSQAECAFVVFVDAQVIVVKESGDSLGQQLYGRLDRCHRGRIVKYKNRPRKRAFLPT